MEDSTWPMWTIWRNKQWSIPMIILLSLAQSHSTVWPWFCWWQITTCYVKYHNKLLKLLKKKLCSSCQIYFHNYSWQSITSAILCVYVSMNSECLGSFLPFLLSRKQQNIINLTIQIYPTLIRMSKWYWFSAKNMLTNAKINIKKLQCFGFGNSFLRLCAFGAWSVLNMATFFFLSLQNI